MPDETPEERIERIRQEGATARQQARITLFTTIFNAVFTLINLLATSVWVPALLKSYHLETVQKVDATKTEVHEVKAEAATAAQKADIAATKGERTEELAQASILQWKAYNSKSPDDMETAHRALGKLEIPN